MRPVPTNVTSSAGVEPNFGGFNNVLIVGSAVVALALVAVLWLGVLKLRARMREAAIGGVYDIIYEGIEDAEHGQDEARSPRSSTLSGASGGEWPSPERRCSFESVGEAEDDGEAVWWSTSLVPTRKRGIIDAPALQV